MSAMQKFAWFNLAVITLTVVVILSLLPFLGKGALGGFGFLGLIGLGAFFFRKKSGHVIADERDRIIQHRSWMLAYALFWLVFVLAAALLLPLVYGAEGAVPVQVVQLSVWCGFMLLMALASISILVQYAHGGPHAE